MYYLLKCHLAYTYFTDNIWSRERDWHIFSQSLHSSEIRSLCWMKCSSKTLQNLLHFLHVVFLILWNFAFFTSWMSWCKGEKSITTQNYMGFLEQKEWQILKRLAGTFCWGLNLLFLTSALSRSLLLPTIIVWFAVLIVCHRVANGHDYLFDCG